MDSNCLSFIFYREDVQLTGVLVSRILFQMVEQYIYIYLAKRFLTLIESYWFTKIMQQIDLNQVESILAM